MKWLTIPVLATVFLVCVGLVFSGNIQNAQAQYQKQINALNENNVPIDLCDAYVCTGKSTAVSADSDAASLSMNGFLATGSVLPCANGQPRNSGGICPAMPACPKQCTWVDNDTNNCWQYQTVNGHFSVQDQRINGYICAWSY